MVLTWVFARLRDEYYIALDRSLTSYRVIFRAFWESRIELPCMGPAALAAMAILADQQSAT